MEYFKSSDFIAHVDHLLEEWHAPGIAIAVVHQNTVSSRGFGNAILEGEKPTPVTGDTVWDIASSSKSMTAAAITLLVEDDEKYPDVKWETSVSRLLPDDFVMAEDEYTKGITVEDILSHRTGIPGHDFSYLSPRSKDVDTPQSVTRNLRNLEISAPIRSKFMYCNMMFTVASYLVEKLSGLSFEDFLRQHFWKPLDMVSTILQPTKAVEAGLPVARPYVWKEESSTYLPVERQYSPEAEGAGLIVTSVNDYIKWVKAMMNQEAPVTAEIYRGLTKPRSFEIPEDFDDLDPFTSPGLYGAGIGSDYYRGYQVMSHTGGDPGVASMHFFVPKIKFGAVLIGNSEGASNVISVLTHELIDEALEVPRAERPDWNAREHKIEAKYEEEKKEQNSQRRKKLCPHVGEEPEDQKTPLSAYTGFYSNAGYHGLTVEVSKDNKLFIDLSDRTMGFTLELEHVCDQTKYIAHATDYYEGDHRELAAEFVLEESRAVKLGLELEDDLPNGGIIWFERSESAALPLREL